MGELICLSFLYSESVTVVTCIELCFVFFGGFPGIAKMMCDDNLQFLSHNVDHGWLYLSLVFQSVFCLFFCLFDVLVIRFSIKKFVIPLFFIGLATC